jgi:hypothetical protein
MRNINALLFLMLLAISCKSVKDGDVSELHVNINKLHQVSVFDIFKKVELIPLETNEKSLIKSIDKVIYSNGKYYVLDKSRQLLLVFDEDGRYLKQIGTPGQGPNEYFNFTDFYISRFSQQIVLLSPSGILYFYDFDGIVQDKRKLEGDVFNYQTFAELTEDLIVLWSNVETDTEQIRIYSKKEKKFIGKYFIEKDPINMLSHSVFHEYGRDVYFSKATNNNVYKITPNQVYKVFKWDFGKENLKIEQYNLPSNPQEKSNKIFEMFLDSKLPYMITDQNQTTTYYYARLRINGNESKHVFYCKENNKYLVFKKFSEDLSFSPYFWQDDYVIGIGNVLGKTMVNATVLDADDAAILSKQTEEDNPCLVKYYFK